MYFVTKAMSKYNVDGRGHKLELKKCRNYLTNHTRSKSHATSYLWPWG